MCKILQATCVPYEVEGNIDEKSHDVTFLRFGKFLVGEGRTGKTEELQSFRTAIPTSHNHSYQLTMEFNATGSHAVVFESIAPFFSKACHYVNSKKLYVWFHQQYRPKELRFPSSRPQFLHWYYLSSALLFFFFYLTQQPFFQSFMKGSSGNGGVRDSLFLCHLYLLDKWTLML